MNIFNEKIYVFFWFYLIILSLLGLLNLAYRLVTLCSSWLRVKILIGRGLWHMDIGAVERVEDKLNIGQWFYLSLLGSNLDQSMFRELIHRLDRDNRPEVDNREIYEDPTEVLLYRK